MNFLFWNVNRQDLNDTIIDLVIENDIDVLMLAEHVGDIENLQRKFLERNRPMYFHRNLPNYERIKILTSFEQSRIERLRDDHHYLAIRVPHKTLGYINLFTVHFFSKLHRNDADFTLKTFSMVNDVIEIEKENDSELTIICGDFNMNPFEEGMVSAGRLHAFPTRKEASKYKRQFDRKEYKMFYNPMWRYIGDDEVLGTYYYSNPHSNGLYWNIFDQVIVRPSLIDNLQNVSIIKQSSRETLGNENGVLVSDHLPITFSVI